MNDSIKTFRKNKIKIESELIQEINRITIKFKKENNVSIKNVNIYFQSIGTLGQELDEYIVSDVKIETNIDD